MARHAAPHAEHALAALAERAAKAGERMTDLRRDVALALMKQREAVSAYSLLALINKKRRKPLSAMSLYRTLDFLIRLGAAVKVESRNAFMACAEAAPDHSHLLIVCDNCGATRDIDDHDATHMLQDIAEKYGHHLKHNVVELHGTCTACDA